jgi:hypothetical protein
MSEKDQFGGNLKDRLESIRYDNYTMRVITPADEEWRRLGLEESENLRRLQILKDKNGNPLLIEFIHNQIAGQEYIEEEFYTGDVWHITHDLSGPVVKRNGFAIFGSISEKTRPLRSEEFDFSAATYTQESLKQNGIYSEERTDVTLEERAVENLIQETLSKNTRFELDGDVILMNMHPETTRDFMTRVPNIIEAGMGLFRYLFSRRDDSIEVLNIYGESSRMEALDEVMSMSRNRILSLLEKMGIEYKAAAIDGLDLTNMVDRNFLWQNIDEVDFRPR